MGKLLSSGRYLIIIAVLSTFVASLTTLIWGAWRMIRIVMDLFYGLSGAESEAYTQGVHLIAVLDSFLLAIVLYIFSVGLYELFIGPIKNVPEWLVIKNLDGLKVKLVNVIILVMAVTFVEHLVQWKDPEATLMLGGATALVLASLVLYSRYMDKEKGTKA